jgi:hypothetical protein
MNTNVTLNVKWVYHVNFDNLAITKEHTPQAFELRLVEEEIELQQLENKNIRIKFFQNIFEE